MRLANAANIREKALTWLWEGLIPCSQTTIIEGDPGTGKSSLAMALAAHVSTGKEWPNGRHCLKGDVIIANAEDPEEEIIIPRLRAAGADLSRCHILLPSHESETFTIPDSVPALEDAIKAWDVRLIILDPLEAYLSGAVDNYRNHHVRRALRSLEHLAKVRNCAVIFIRHLNKATEKSAIYRGGGSIGIIGAARAALSVGRDRTNSDRCIIVPVKQNWTKVHGGIAYKTEEVSYVTANGTAITTSRIVWDGTVYVSADDVITTDQDESPTAVEEAAEFIRQFLVQGPKPSETMFNAAQAIGLSRKTLWRASRLMNIAKRKEGFGANGHWVWELKPAPSKEEEQALINWAIENSLNSSATDPDRKIQTNRSCQEDSADAQSERNSSLLEQE